MKVPIKFFILHLILFLLLLIQNTHVSDSFFGDEPWIYYAALILMFSSICCYAGSFINPGFVDDKCEVTPFYCNTCQHRIPVRAFHCNKCKRCVRRHLHHSDWAAQCIGLENQFSYFLFLGLESLFLLFSIIIICLSLTRVVSYKQFLHQHCLLFLTLPYILYNLVQSAILFFEHVYIIATNGNVLEVKYKFGIMYLYIEPKTNNPFDLKSIEKNSGQVFFPMKDRRWEIPNSQSLVDYCNDIRRYRNIEFINDQQ